MYTVKYTHFSSCLITLYMMFIYTYLTVVYSIHYDIKKNVLPILYAIGGQ